MAIKNQLIMTLLRIITPEEIAEIATRQNGGRFLMLNDLLKERIEKKIYRSFSTPEEMDNVYLAHSGNKKPNENNDEDQEIESEAKILPFDVSKMENGTFKSFDESAIETTKNESTVSENQNTSHFILSQKTKLEKSQKTLKEKEIIELYKKNVSVDVEEIKGQRRDEEKGKSASAANGVLVNRKHY